MIETTTKTKTQPLVKNADDLFGEYVTSELKTVEDEALKRKIKFHIQSVMFSIQNHGNTSQMFPYGTAPPQPNYGYNNGSTYPQQSNDRNMSMSSNLSLPHDYRILYYMYITL